MVKLLLPKLKGSLPVDLINPFLRYAEETYGGQEPGTSAAVYGTGDAAAANTNTTTGTVTGTTDPSKTTPNQSQPSGPSKAQKDHQSRMALRMKLTPLLESLQRQRDMVLELHKETDFKKGITTVKKYIRLIEIVEKRFPIATGANGNGMKVQLGWGNVFSGGMDYVGVKEVPVVSKSSGKGGPNGAQDGGKGGKGNTTSVGTTTNARSTTTLSQHGMNPWVQEKCQALFILACLHAKYGNNLSIESGKTSVTCGNTMDAATQAALAGLGGSAAAPGSDKEAIQYYCQSAGIFQLCRMTVEGAAGNTANLPTDLQPEALMFWENLLIASANHVVYTNAVSADRDKGLLAKLAQRVSDDFQSCLQRWVGPGIKGRGIVKSEKFYMDMFEYLDTEWRVYRTAATLQQARKELKLCEASMEQRKLPDWGSCLKRYRMASARAEDLRSRDYHWNVEGDTIVKVANRAHQEFRKLELDCIKIYSNPREPEKLDEVVPVPVFSKVTQIGSIEKLVMSGSNIVNNNEGGGDAQTSTNTTNVNDEDLMFIGFTQALNSLVPKFVDDAISQYLLKAQEASKEIEDAAQPLEKLVNDSLAEMKLPHCLESEETSNVTTNSNRLPPSLWSKVQVAQGQGGDNNLKQTLAMLQQYENACNTLIRETEDILEVEANSDLSMRKAFPDKWKRKESKQLTVDTVEKLKDYKAKLQQALSVNTQVKAEALALQNSTGNQALTVAISSTQPPTEAQLAGIISGNNASGGYMAPPPAVAAPVVPSYPGAGNDLWGAHNATVSAQPAVASAVPGTVTDGNHSPLPPLNPNDPLHALRFALQNLEMARRHYHTLRETLKADMMCKERTIEPLLFGDSINNYMSNSMGMMDLSPGGSTNIGGGVSVNRPDLSSRAAVDGALQCAIHRHITMVMQELRQVNGLSGSSGSDIAKCQKRIRDALEEVKSEFKKADLSVKASDRVKKLTELETGLNKFAQLMNDSRDGVEFFVKLSNVLSQLKQQTQDYSMARDQEKNMMLQQMGFANPAAQQAGAPQPHVQQQPPVSGFQGPVQPYGMPGQQQPPHHQQLPPPGPTLNPYGQQQHYAPQPGQPLPGHPSPYQYQPQPGAVPVAPVTHHHPYDPYAPQAPPAGAPYAPQAPPQAPYGGAYPGPGGY